VDLDLVVEEPVSEASRQQLTEQLIAYQSALYGEPHYATLGLFLRDDGGQLQAGLSGRFRWGWLYVEMLWVAEPLRGRGYGSRLLTEAEEFARARGGIAVQLDSGGGQALPFYRKHGYEIVGRMDGYPPGSAHHFLRKWLASR
jgi:ribosomal protein S18 acetylase RimI-like enzyme